MRKFKREDRYMVIKYNDAQHLSLTDNAHLSRIGKRLERFRAEHRKPPLHCVVVESDWPEYEPVFKMIEARVNGAAPMAPAAPDTVALIEECKAALAEELAAWDLDPPLHHVLHAHDACVAWLAAHAQQTTPAAQTMTPTPPSEPGWYWAQWSPTTKPEMTEVWRNPRGLWAKGAGYVHNADCQHALWSRRIPEPVMPEAKEGGT